MIIENQYPVTSGPTIVESMRTVCEQIDKVQGHNVVTVETDANGLRHKIDEAVRAQDFINSLRSLDRILDVALDELWKASREDLLRLLEDPLSSETRSTRRNLGVLTVLAALTGAAGKPPDSLLGFRIVSFPHWVFPIVLACVISYEFVAFRLYLRADLERRKIQSEAAGADHGKLQRGLFDFEKRARGLMAFMSSSLAKGMLNGMGEVPERTTVLDKCSQLRSHWRKDVSAFDTEFRVQRSRRGWDEHVPVALFMVSALSLLSMLRVLW